MHAVGELLRSDEQLQQHQGPVSFAVDPKHHPDYCSCQKAAGEWGNHGFHWREFGEIDIRLRVAKEMRGLPPDIPAFDRELIEARVRKELAIYVGRHVAIEQCPHYRAALQADVDSRRAQQRDSRHDLTLGDDL